MSIRIAIVVALLFLLGYGVREAYPLLAGPDIRIESPEEYASLPDGNVTLSGVAERTETLYLNGGPLLIDQDGRFSTSLVLPEGGAILSLTATDRFGRSRTIERTIYIPKQENHGSEEESESIESNGSTGIE